VFIEIDAPSQFVNVKRKVIPNESGFVAGGVRDLGWDLRLRTEIELDLEVSKMWRELQ
jgi:hypothetical protein